MVNTMTENHRVIVRWDVQVSLGKIVWIVDDELDNTGLFHDAAISTRSPEPPQHFLMINVLNVLLFDLPKFNPFIFSCDIITSSIIGLISFYFWAKI